MKRSFLSVFALIVLAAALVVVRSDALPGKLETITHQLEGPEGLDPRWGMHEDLEKVAQSATMDEIRQVIPALVTLTESPNAQLRANALLVLWSIARRNKAGLPENRRELDLTASKAMIPYISRLAPRLMDASPQCLLLSIYLFSNLAAIRPILPELIQAALTALNSPQSTQPMADPAVGPPSSPGPPILWVLIPAGAEGYRDPATNIPEIRDSPEVQAAIIQFLHRPDQTTESLSESIRALAIAQVQSPAVNAELLPLLNSSDVIVKKVLLRYIPRLSLPSEDFPAARARVASIATDPNTAMVLRKYASSRVTCWSNDRYHDHCPDLLPEP